MNQSSNICQKSFSLTSFQDGLVLDVLTIMPESPKALLQLAHGMCEHKERYIPFMEYLAGQGIGCIISDHRGHGKSVKDMEDFGYFYENGGPSLVKDLHQITRFIRREYPDLPFFLFGHSMGSLAVRVYLKHYERELSGLIVCGSPSNNPLAGPGMVLVRLLAGIRGEHSRSRLINKLFSASLEKPFQADGVHSWISGDKDVVKAYNASPYCNFTFTLNGYLALLWLVKNTYDKKGWKVKNPDLPILFLSGGDDPCMISKEKFEEAVTLLKDAGYQNVNSKIYPGLRHEILNESKRQTVYEDAAKFLLSALPSENTAL